MSLTLGRVVLVGAEAWSDQGGQVRVSGRQGFGTLGEAQAVLDNLAGLAGFVPVISTADPRRDGFYQVSAVQTAVGEGWASRLVSWDARLERLGAASEVEFQSLLTGTVLANDHGVDAAEAEPYHAPPRAHLAYDPGATVPGFVTRTGAGGAIRVYRDVSYTVDPRWSVAPANFYAEAAELRVGGFLRAGLRSPNTPADWELSNGLVRVTPHATGGRLNVAHYDGTQWDTAKEWRIVSGGADVGAWDALAILRNDPEECALRLTREISAGGRVTLDLALRRGSRFVTGFLARHAAATLRVQIAGAGEAATAVTPTGATSAVGLRASVNDAGGNRYVLGSAKSHTQDLVIGALEKASTPTLDFFIGSAIGGDTAQAGDQPADLCLQYLGWLSEVVRPIRR